MSDLFNIFRNIFGLPSRNPRDNHRDDGTNERADEFPTFNVYTDPLEMHRFFESQMNEMLKMFTGITGFGSGDVFPSESPFNGPPTFFPALPDADPQRNLRDEYLKPGYRQSDNSDVDTDLDGKITSADLDGILSKKDNGQVLPARPNNFSNFNFQSSTTVITRRPDGTVEKRLVQRDHLGNEKTTVEVTGPQGESSNSLPEYYRDDDIGTKTGRIWDYFKF